VSDEANAHNAVDPVELWKNWNEITTRMMASSLDGKREAYRDLSDLYSLWMMPAAFFKLWYNATSGTWSRLVGDVMCRSWQIPSRVDMAHVAKHIVALEERIYMIEDVFVNFEVGSLEVAPGHQVVDGRVTHQEGIEDKLNTTDTLPTIPPHTTVIGDLAGRLERVEGKLDRLLGVLERIEARVGAESAWFDGLDKGGKGQTPEEG
jgi:hypothetical protein